MMRRVISTSALAVSLALSVPAFAQGADGKGKEWDDLVKAAQREGQVEAFLYGGLNLQKAVPAFEKKYGVKVNYQTGSSRKQAERILAERRMGRFTLDVWIGGSGSALTKLMPNGVLVPIDELLVDPEVTDPSKWFKGKHHYTDPEGRYIFTWGAAPAQNIVYNTDMVDPEEIRSYWELLDPKWKGKIVAMSPGIQGNVAQSVPLVLNPKIGYEWFRRWANEMDVTIVADRRQGAEWVALGRFPIGMFGLNRDADELAAQGFPIKNYLPHPIKEGEILSAGANNIMVLDRAPHPNAMKLFVNWLLSEEGQQLAMEVGETRDSLRTDVDNSVIGSKYRIPRDGDYSIPFDNPDYINKQGEILTNLRKIMKDAGYQ
jgi:iron(III) transport system substrate-binding protein